MPTDAGNLRPARWWILVVAAAVILSVLAVFNGRVVPLGQITGTDTASREGPYRFKPGTRIVHRLDYRSQGKTNFLAVFGGGKAKNDGEPSSSMLEQTFRSGVLAERSITILDWKEGAWWAAVRMENVKVSFAVGGQEDPDQSERLRRELSGDVFVRIAPEGRALSVRFPEEMGILSKTLVQTLLGITQFVFPEKGIPADGRWEVEEEDRSGRSVVLYERITPDGAASPPTQTREEAASYRKTRLRYLSSSRKKIHGQISLDSTTVPKGSLIARVQVPNGDLVSMVGTEVQEIFIGDKQVGHAENSLHLEFIRRVLISLKEKAELRERIVALEASSPEITLSANLSMEAGLLEIERRTLGNATPESLLSDLREGIRSGEGFDPDLSGRLKALFYLDPATCALFGKELAGADVQSRSFMYVSGALASVGNAKAQEALIGAVRARRRDVPALVLMLSTLGDVQDPEPAIADTLEEFAFGGGGDEQVVAVARQALGSVARNLGPKHPEREKKILDTLVEELGKSPSDDKKVNLLSALGNSGSLSTLPAVLKCLTSGSGTVRSAAASSLRLLDAPEVEPVLLHALTADPEESVRQQAASVLQDREMTETAFAAQASAVLKDASPNVRITLLRTLSNVQGRYPKARSVIRQVAKEDPSEDIRRAAEKILEANHRE